MSLQICPECHHLTIEFDPHQRVYRCLNKRCGWVNRGRPFVEGEPESFAFSRVMEARVREGGMRYPGATWIGTPHFGFPQGTHGQLMPLAICDHIMCGTLAGCDAWFNGDGLSCRCSRSSGASPAGGERTSASRRRSGRSSSSSAPGAGSPPYGLNCARTHRRSTRSTRGTRH